MIAAVVTTVPLGLAMVVQKRHQWMLAVACVAAYVFFVLKFSVVSLVGVSHPLPGPVYARQEFSARELRSMLVLFSPLAFYALMVFVWRIVGAMRGTAQAPSKF